MEDRDTWIAGHWGCFLAILISLFAAVFAIWRPDASLLVPLYLFGALLGWRLSARDYRVLVFVLAVVLVLPMFFEGREHAGSITDLTERLAGLLCLGLLVLLRDRQWYRQGDLAHATSSESDSGRWGHALVGVNAGSDSMGLETIGSVISVDDLNHDRVDSSEPITSDLTQIRSEASDWGDAKTIETELSFEHRSFHSDAARLLGKLKASGKFSDEQIEIVETELRSSMGSNLGGSVGAALEPGVQIGRFIVDEPLGRGGEGNVYRGHDLSGEPAAIKILHNMRVSDRFRREMHLARQLAHPNIVTAYEVGEYRGLPFITMELLQGPDLHVLVRESGPLIWQESSRYVLQAAHALAHAHHRDLVHRDVKPGNLILNGDGIIKLVDLGLASMGGNETGIESVIQFETQEGHLAGTLPYMAPEQARSLADATVQSDIYGLGATWFYLLTGMERLRGNTFSKQFENLLLRRRFNPLPDNLMPESLRQVYRRMVAYDVRDRYSDCGQLATDLGAALIAAGEPVVAVEGINVLVVEDSRTDMVLTIEMLRRSNSTLSIHEARTLSDGLGVCSKMPIDLVLLDLSLPDSSGVDTVTRFRREVQNVPLVVLTGLTHDEVGNQCLSAGANTFISKSGLTPHRMERTIFVTLSRCGLPRRPSKDLPED